MQANEALKILLAIGEPLIGRLQIIDALAMHTTELSVAKNPDCPICGARRTIHTLEDAPACPLPSDIVDTWTGALLVDVREADEYAKAHIDGAVHISLNDIARNATELRDKDVVLYCKSGQRARRAWEVLRGKGLTRVRMLRGGVNDQTESR